MSSRQRLPRQPLGLLIDLDGTLYVGDDAIAGAPEAIASIRASGTPLRFMTNTTRVPRTALVDRLDGLGIPARLDEVFTAPLAAAAWLRQRGIRRIALCLPAHVREDFAGFDIADSHPEAVVVGDLGEAWTFDRVNQAFSWLHDGATLVALHRNRFWRTSRGLAVDAGAYVAALEYSAGVEAVLVGKPNRPMFDAAAASMAVAVRDVAMVGDDVLADVGGAKDAGAMGILVQTGKYQAAQPAPHAPDVVLASIAGLPALLSQAPEDEDPGAS